MTKENRTHLHIFECGCGCVGVGAGVAVAVGKGVGMGADLRFPETHTNSLTRRQSVVDQQRRIAAH